MPISLTTINPDEVLRYMGTPPDQAGADLRVSQILSVILCIGAVVALIVLSRRPHAPLFAQPIAPQAEQVSPAGQENVSPVEPMASSAGQAGEIPPETAEAPGEQETAQE